MEESMGQSMGNTTESMNSMMVTQWGSVCQLPETITCLSLMTTIVLELIQTVIQNRCVNILYIHTYIHNVHT